MSRPHYTFDIHDFNGELYVLITDEATGEVRETLVNDAAEVIDYPQRVWNQAKRIGVIGEAAL